MRSLKDIQGEFRRKLLNGPWYHGSNTDFDFLKATDAGRRAVEDSPEGEVLNGIYLTQDRGRALAMALTISGEMRNNHTLKEIHVFGKVNQKKPVYLYSINPKDVMETVPEREIMVPNENQIVITGIKELPLELKKEKYGIDELLKYYKVVTHSRWRLIRLFTKPHVHGRATHRPS